MQNDKKRLLELLQKSPVFSTFFKLSDRLQVPNWYVAGGCVTQTIWNFLTNREAMHGLKDVDLVYFDANANKEKEAVYKQETLQVLQEVPLPIDLQNEATVHTWYQQKFGDKIEPYRSVEDGINTWLPAFAVGVRKEGEHYQVYSPYGLDDTLSLVVRPNRKQITKSIYENMCRRLVKDWPEITIIPWST